MHRLTITRPDDWHLHLRSGDLLQTVVAHSASQFGRAVVMPNLVTPIVTVTQALEYRRQILASLPAGSDFQPLMTLYLTDATEIADVAAAAAADCVVAFKLYPAGATTHSARGVSDVAGIFPVLAAMEELGVLLLVHAEVADARYDVFDREKAFLDGPLAAIRGRFPALRIVVEHLTTEDAVQFVRDAGAGVAATVTPQHLMFNRNAMLAGGIRPHFYCLPVLKREHHRQALVAAATSGDPRFFLGTDSAPHPTSAKESACGCAGCFNAPAALAMYAQVFEQANALARLEAFASFHGADFYGLPRNAASLQLEKCAWTVPAQIGNGHAAVTPLLAGETLHWRVVPG